MGRKKNKKRIKKTSIRLQNEELKQSIISPDIDTGDLSTTANIDQTLFNGDYVWSESENTFMDYSNTGGDDKYNLWRSLVARFIDVKEALTEIVNETVVPAEDVDDLIFEPQFKRRAKIPDTTQQRIAERWERLYEILNMDFKADEYFTQFYIDGVQHLEAVYDNNDMGKGIQGVQFLEPKGLRKFWDQKKRKSYWSYHKEDNVPDDKRIYEDQLSSANSGIWDSSSKMYLSYLNYAVLPLNRLDSVETSVITYCLTRSLEKIVYYVDVGKLKETKKKQKVREIANSLRTKSRYDKRSGTVTNTPSKIQLGKEIFIGTNGGEKSTTIDNISADRFDIGDLSVLNWYQDKAYRSLMVPRLRQQKESTFSFDNPSEIEREEINFFKFITLLRKKWEVAWRDLLLKDCIANNIISEDKYNFYARSIVFKWSNNNNYAELRKLNQISFNMEIIDKVSQYVQRPNQVEDEGEMLTLFDVDYIYDEILGWDEIKTKNMKDRLNGKTPTSKDIKNKDDSEPPRNVTKRGEEGNDVDTSTDEPSDDEQVENLRDDVMKNIEGVDDDSLILKIDPDSIDVCLENLEEGNMMHIPNIGTWKRVNGNIVEL